MNLILLFLLVISCTLLLGLAFLVDRNQPKLRQGTNVLVVLGSGINKRPGSRDERIWRLALSRYTDRSLYAGGHTAEMLTLLQKWGGKEGRRRSYVVAATDKLSAQKAQRYEEALQQKTAATQRVRKAMPLAFLQSQARSCVIMHSLQVETRGSECRILLASQYTRFLAAVK